VIDERPGELLEELAELDEQLHEPLHWSPRYAVKSYAV
jgi:hypothetical protein